MATVQLDIEGLTFGEALQLQSLLSESEGVQRADFVPFLPGTKQTRSFPTGLEGKVLHYLIEVASVTGLGAGIGIGKAASEHLYKRVGEAIVDRVWAGISQKFGREDVVRVTLYAPDGSIIKSMGKPR